MDQTDHPEWENSQKQDTLEFSRHVASDDNNICGTEVNQDSIFSLLTDGAALICLTGLAARRH